MIHNKKRLGAVLLSSALLLGACGTTDDNGQTETTEPTTTTEENKDTEKNTNEMIEDNTLSENGHEDMEHDESGEVPEGMKEAENPTYPVGSEVAIENDHMPGMKGANGTVVGVFDTTAYEVTYKDTKTGEKVANHKWVVHEELENAQDEPYQAGDEVVLEASHMPGMKGATATVDSAEKTNVYMVTYTDTETGEQIENHKWMSEDELSPAE
ncbi:YdhK family protein [uncultured Anaerococcus sp.]|uniref:YdhK family protein n=1 Tax=uncultured Anaerococcus sp. TaxID=293428 RepID=UPI0025F9D9DB|nr:YdhK family protein [uncultured Anaerococcus sp.]